MPRLTTKTYLAQRAALRREWFENHANAFVMLTPTEQILLHRYYEPTKKLSQVEVLEHRAQVSKRSRSLPQQAGRAFARLRPFLELPAGPPLKWVGERSVSKPGQRLVHVTSLVRPDLDPDEFARIIMELAKQGPPPTTDNERAE